MKRKINRKLLGAYDFILGVGAIAIGAMMVNSKKGIFAEYPKEWLSIIPFTSWVIPGIIVIVLFGLGNIYVAISFFRSENKNACFMSTLMGSILFVSIVAQIIILGEWYLATVEFMILSIIQICLSAYALLYYKRESIMC
ncbi:hypothetical protein [Clostridium formicaceticum]|uniref:Uncharacterized protein n=1 Tax=Clostridium formicaceticum TaxID=1497 RepID=A0AAC9RN29_9CLOT|nr:hypothetical protein [Clostridium formicaceticum]AOY76807.1 hypothetical protein BJL90_13660 [Clostridium formicaceticum]ARE87275.1 hypothetical protein CLFO_16740 [Clostridium formicaceticum]